MYVGNSALASGSGYHDDSQEEQLAMAALSASLHKLFSSSGGGSGGVGSNPGDAAVGRPLDANMLRMNHHLPSQIASQMASTLDYSSNIASPLASTLESSRNISLAFDNVLRTPHGSPLRGGGGGGQ